MIGRGRAGPFGNLEDDALCGPRLANADLERAQVRCALVLELRNKHLSSKASRGFPHGVWTDTLWLLRQGDEAGGAKQIAKFHRDAALGE